MKLDIIGSRTLTCPNLADYIPENTTEIVSGGAAGIDTAAAEFAEKNNIKRTVFLPQYDKYSRGAPLKRNEQIADYDDCALAFWDGSSKGTLHTIRQIQKRNKSVRVIQIKTTG